MPRVISFLVLLTIVLLVGAVFFQVMAQFLVPLFLASVLLVVFQPLHAWMLRRLPTHPRLSALFTTLLILLSVLLPLTWLGWNAYGELTALLSQSKHAAVGADAAVPNPAPLADAASDEEVSDALSVRLKKLAVDLASGLERMIHVRLNDETVGKLIDKSAGTATTLVISGVQSVFGILVGLVIMVIALYYFLADGPGMIRTVMELSPLETAYEQELLNRFSQVSRAVVVATLLSAVVQGLLAGIGYYFALPGGAPIFLLTVVTMFTALVPFVGAAAAWVPVCVWVYLYGERIVDGVVQQPPGNWVTAVALAIYSAVVVSGIDNIIKPLVLRGQSNLHPLLALLSILGGVQVLGPVGILVGPMLVSFLQALLEMLRKELDSFGTEPAGVSGVLADASGAPVGQIPLEKSALNPAAALVSKTQLPASRQRRRKK